MTKREVEARERIIAAASELIREQGGTESITMRDIAARAGVGAGLINYHFQTREHLLDLCTQRIIGQVIGGFDALYASLDMPPVGKLRFLVKENVKFLLKNPGISRASILHDMVSPGPGDNTAQTLHAYFPVIREVCAGAPDVEVRVLLQALISTLQAAFLRGEAFRAESGFDMQDTAERDGFVDLLISSIFHRYIAD